jgi:hypothetical protein
MGCSMRFHLFLHAHTDNIIGDHIYMEYGMKTTLSYGLCQMWVSEKCSMILMNGE